MLVKNFRDVVGTPYHVDWGNGTSHRLVTADDKMGFGVCHTIVRAGTASLMQYKNHLEACYCISGSGEIEDMEGNIYSLGPGDIYILDKHDEHILRAHEGQELILISIFNPPLKGTERHDFSNNSASSYEL